MAPRDDDPSPATVRPDVVPESALLETDLARYDAVFLCDVAQFTASEARALTAYVRGGGGLVVFLGDRVAADRYNRQLGGKDGLLPASLGKVVDQAKPGIDPLDYRHPIVAAVSRPRACRAVDHAAGQVRQADRARATPPRGSRWPRPRAIRWWSSGRSGGVG